MSKKDNIGKLPKWAAEYMEKWIKLLRLQVYDITAKTAAGPAGDLDNVGGAWVNRNVLRAAIEIKDDIPKKRPKEAAARREWELTIIHELLHVLLSDLQRLVTDDMLPFLGSEARAMIGSIHDNRIEQAVERLAVALHTLEGLENGKP